LRTRRFITALALVAFLIAPSIGRAESDFEAAEILFTQAVLEYDANDYAAAARDLLKAHALDSGNANVIYYLGLTYNAQGNFAEAERYLREGVALQPKNLDLRYELGIALYGEKRYDDALKEFLAVVAADPHRDHAGYYAGLCYYQKRDYENAVTYFRRNVSTDIKTRQLNQYYLGLALRELGRGTEAIEELTEVVKIEPASPIVGPTQQLLTVIREEAGGKRLRLEATFNGQFDSNPDGQNNAKKSYGNLLNARADYTVYRSGPWDAAVTYSFLQTLNYENHRGDITDNLVGASLYYKTLLGGMRAIFGFQANNDIFLLNGELFIQRPTGTATLTLQENASNFTTMLLRPQYKDFMLKGVAEKRRAANELVGLVHYIRFGAGGLNQFNFGYHFDNEDAIDTDWSYTGHKVIAGVLVALPWGLRASSNFEFHFRSYPAHNSEFGGHRRDNEATLLTALAKDIRPNLTATLQHFWDRNYSTTSDFNISRHVTALGLTWRY